MKRSILLGFWLFLMLTSLVAVDRKEGIGYRYHNTGHNPLILYGELEEKSHHGTLSYTGKNNLLLTYDHEFPLSSTFYCLVGGAFNAIDGYTFALLPETMVGYRKAWPHFHVDFQVGGQVGIAKFRSLDQVLFSLSPTGGIEGGITFGGIDYTTFISMRQPVDRTWKATIVCGQRLEKHFRKGLTLGLEVWGRCAEYMMDNWTMFDSISSMIYLSTKGGSL